MSTFYLPEQVGKGMYQSMTLGSYATWSFCDMTPCRDIIVDEQDETRGLVLAFNLSGQQQWRNRDTGRRHVFLENSFGVFDAGPFAASNVFEKGQRVVQMGLHIHPGRYDPLLEAIRKTGAISKFNDLSPHAGMDMPTLARHVIQEMLECKYMDEIREYYLEGKLTELLAIVAGELTGRDQTALQTVKLSETDRAGLATVKRILDENYAESPTIPDLVRPAMMNEHKLKRAFKQQFGISIHAYIIQKRMEKAYELLHSGKVNVTEAAQRVGYVNSSYFISRFRQMYGYNPGILKK
ncbi:AraC family transcriptional regulator [Paenibacillus sp. ACRRY]|uniref:helix-turn-helix transcriptional regulator n=1 Tax=Paenibacillus sp. ACRRY TaxID=2918208 RepID=UPI001EF54AF3|nr:AraC family transcriptional regulator [Paenibacillus sp. ACRRY]MCG7384947.1 AraC family transcriptional regulator [Paenibacillus sp. ACRRY]